MELSGVGIWSSELRYSGAESERAERAAELEAVGYSALWVPGGAGGAVLDDCRRLLDATDQVTVATGILNLWMHEPADVATGHAALTAAHPDRFLLGIGVSHSLLVDATEPGKYARPLATTASTSTRSTPRHHPCRTLSASSLRSARRCSSSHTTGARAHTRTS